METPRVLVPLYVHPAIDPAAWADLSRSADRLYGVVLNPASGPGGFHDPAFTEAIAPLRAAGVPVLGYLDSGYGGRPADDLVAESRTHRAWYDTDGVFLDQVSSEAGQLSYYQGLVGRIREAGAGIVVLNPGVHPDPGYALIADLLVTFEGDWRAYRRIRVPSWTTGHPADRFCHLVHGVPAGLSALAERLATRHGAAVHCAVTAGPPNPWGALPEGLRYTSGG